MVKNEWKNDFHAKTQTYNSFEQNTADLSLKTTIKLNIFCLCTRTRVPLSNNSSSINQKQVWKNYDILREKQ